MNLNEQKTLEQKVGRKAALKLESLQRKVVKHLFETTAGNSEILKGTVKEKMVAHELERLQIILPEYAYMHHFGFDGVRKNGIRLRLYRHIGFLNKALTEPNVLEQLATEIAEIRGEQVTNMINF